MPLPGHTIPLTRWAGTSRWLRAQRMPFTLARRYQRWLAGGHSPGMRLFRVGVRPEQPRGNDDPQVGARPVHKTGALMSLRTNVITGFNADRNRVGFGGGQAVGRLRQPRMSSVSDRRRDGGRLGGGADRVFRRRMDRMNLHHWDVTVSGIGSQTSAWFRNQGYVFVRRVERRSAT